MGPTRKTFFDIMRTFLLAACLAVATGFMAPVSTVAATRAGAARMSAVSDVMEKLESMTLLEAAELVKAIEETFDVDASAASGGGMMMMAPGAAAGGDVPAAAEEKTEFDLVLEESKELVEGAPKALKEGAAKAECEEAQKKLEELGAKVTLKQTMKDCVSDRDLPDRDQSDFPSSALAIRD